MSFPKYPEYKDSGVEWLGEVPAHWDVTPVRAFVEEQTAKNASGDEENYLSLMANVGVIPYEEKGDVGNKKPDDLSKCKKVDIGDLVINSMNYGIGSYGLSGLKGVCSPVYIVLRPMEEKVLPRYALRIFENKEFQKLAQSFGQGILAHRSAIGWDDLKNIKVPMPGTAEQAQLSAFLDHETARIDALVEEQQRLIELLKEKRQAVISHAVTKGLDPDVPMKDSGVEWLGEVPAHWEVCKLGHVCRLQGGYAFNSSGFSQDGVTIVRMNNLKRGRLDLESSVKVSPDDCDSRFQLAEGDILYGMSGSIGDTGSLGNYAIVSRDDLPAQLNQRVGRFLLERGLLNSYLELVIQSSSFYEQVLDQVTGTAQFNVSSDQVESCKITFPKIEEQAVIARDVRARLEKMDKLMDLAADQIHYLQERRSALISAAVTGKIDVRGWQPPEGSTASSEATQTEVV